MKQIMAMIMTVCVILGTVTGCGGDGTTRTDNGEYYLKQLEKSLRGSFDNTYAREIDVETTEDGTVSHSLEIINLSTEKQLGTVVFWDDKATGDFVKVEAAVYGEQVELFDTVSNNLLRVIGYSDSDIEAICSKAKVYADSCTTGVYYGGNEVMFTAGDGYWTVIRIVYKPKDYREGFLSKNGEYYSETAPEHKLIQTTTTEKNNGNIYANYFVVTQANLSDMERLMIFNDLINNDITYKYHTVFFYEEESIAWEDVDKKEQYTCSIDDMGSKLDVFQNPYLTNGLQAFEQTNPFTISKLEYDSVKNGLSYQQVVEIIGGEGKILSEVGSPGDDLYTAIYMWPGEGETGANANVTFQENKVQMKAQYGLQ